MRSTFISGVPKCEAPDGGPQGRILGNPLFDGPLVKKQRISFTNLQILSSGHLRGKRNFFIMISYQQYGIEGYKEVHSTVMFEGIRGEAPSLSFFQMWRITGKQLHPLMQKDMSEQKVQHLRQPKSDCIYHAPIDLEQLTA